uniref:Uncharacterized protein n=1 Tax=Caulerpa ashmeadii TaxID=177078 RepID=A0A6B9VWH3_9CHLO|nr:hypothetical protein [Caulerpa ashmeadii]QHQ73237.1 hypothetical protein [Caulerpa ashmeadii]
MRPEGPPIYRGKSKNLKTHIELCKDIIFKDNLTKPEIKDLLNTLNKKERPWFEKYILPVLLDKKQSLPPLRKIQEIKTTCETRPYTYQDYPSFKNIYHILHHPQTLLRASTYPEITLTPGVNRETLDGFSMTHILNLHLKTQSYKPLPESLGSQTRKTFP